MEQTANLFSSDQACAWIARLRSDAVSQADKLAFSRWLNSDQRHEAAFDEALSAWQTTGALRYTPATRQLLADAASSQPTRWFSWQPALAAGLAALALATFMLLPSTPEPAPSQQFTTVRGEQRTLDLDDGSQVQLNTDSVLSVSFTDSQRLLNLVQGEAFFRVAANRHRPFVVNTDAGTVTAVGTAFAVSKTTDGIKVTVIEGIVSVKEHQSQPEIKPETRLVKADEGLILSQQGLSEVRSTNADKSLAWRNGLLVLENQPLTEAISELNRYLAVPVSADPSLAKLRVSGTFSLQSPESTLAGLATSFNLAQDNSGDTPRLYARPE